jgi:hypothetical protein
MSKTWFLGLEQFAFSLNVLLVIVQTIVRIVHLYGGLIIWDLDKAGFV